MSRLVDREIVITKKISGVAHTQVGNLLHWTTAEPTLAKATQVLRAHVCVTGEFVECPWMREV